MVRREQLIGCRNADAEDVGGDEGDVRVAEVPDVRAEMRYGLDVNVLHLLDLVAGPQAQEGREAPGEVTLGAPGGEEVTGLDPGAPGVLPPGLGVALDEVEDVPGAFSPRDVRIRELRRVDDRRPGCCDHAHGCSLLVGVALLLLPVPRVPHVGRLGTR